MTMSRKTGRNVSAMWVTPLRRSTIVYVTTHEQPVAQRLCDLRRLGRNFDYLEQADSSDIGPISTGGQFGHWSYLNRQTVRTLVLSQQADSSDIGPISTGGQFGHWSYLNRRTVQIGPMSELSAC